MSQSPAACPPEDDILAFVEGTKSGREREAVEAHLSDCASCRRLVSALARDATDGTDLGARRAAAATGLVGELTPGAVVAGKYEILEVLGRGGMGVVLLAFHRTLRQRVALKFLLGEHARDAGLVSRFFREARAAAALGSDHVVRILDADRDPQTGAPFVALEYLDGRDLARVLREDGPLPIATAVDWALQAAEALALAHRHAIVHRDVKPANLFLARQPDGSLRLKVLDFGIAKMAASVAHTSGSTDQTGPAMVLGSPRYMAPEQLKDSSSVDERADVWALGVTLFELLTGASAFGGTSLIELCASIAVDEPRSLRALRAEVPPALEGAVLRCLVKPREGRTASMGQLAADLAPYAGPEGVRAAERARRVTESRPPGRPPTSISGAVASVTPASLGEDSTIRATSMAHSATRPRTTVAAAIGLTAVGAGVGLWLLAGSSRVSTTDPSSLATEHRGAPIADASRSSVAVDAPIASGTALASAPPVIASDAASVSAAPSGGLPPPGSAGAPSRRGAPGSSVASSALPRPPPPTPASPPLSSSPPAAPPAKSPPPAGTTALHRDGLTDRK